jgi:hypothetical protein
MMSNHSDARGVEDISAGTRPDAGLIRIPWAFLLGLNFVSFLLWGYSSISRNFHPLELLLLLPDLIALSGLFGYVVRKPIRSQALRVTYLLLVPVLSLRAILVMFLAGKALVELPWAGHVEQYVSLVNLASTPLLAFTAIALWLYATSPQRKSTTTDENRKV